jgi:arabinogalactan endo-1,4-beta-galactosidase
MQSPIFKTALILFLSAFLFLKCSKNNNPKPSFYLGGDLSYVNEMENCGGVYRDKTNKVDAFKFFAENGANIVRVRLWHTPKFNRYSSLADVEKTIKRAKNEGQAILLDLHFSDNWADPSKQIMPTAWQKTGSYAVLGDSVYRYTLSTLEYLHRKNLTPEMVQIGNEINIGIIQHPDSASSGPINWVRNAFLLNKGIEAVTFFNQKNNTRVETMLHIAQPENAEPWFKEAALYNVKKYDWIGLSYYPKWSKFDLNQLGITISTLKSTHGKRIMIVETGFPYSSKEFDKANNVLGEDAALKNYPVSPEGQLSFMLDLKTKCKNVGAEGIIYWEPAWISTKCKTQWGEGSHWENAAFFDAGNGNEALPVFKFLKSNF